MQQLHYSTLKYILVSNKKNTNPRINIVHILPYNYVTRVCGSDISHRRTARHYQVRENIVVYVGMGLDFHQILSRQLLRVKGCIAFRWVVLSCHQSDY